MTTFHRTPDGTAVYSKGAVEVILGACNRFQSDGRVLPLTKEVHSAITAAVHALGREAMRVLGVAYLPAGDTTQAERDMIFLGCAGMIDPPRPEAKAAIERCRQAGIRPMMITGDHPVTAEAIARELGLLEPGGRVVTGGELSSMDEPELERMIDDVAVCARVSPEHKLRVVGALQRRGNIVAMTGDGVNDAPALKKANIGIAMGITGTDVTKEAGAITLTDDNFASIVAAVEEGRIIFGNIKKYLMYLLSSNIGEIGLMGATTLLGMPLPLSAVQLLYVNLATDGLPALALAVDPPEADVMQHRPRDMSRGIFSRPVVALMLTGGIWSTLVNLGLFTWVRHSGRGTEEGMTMTFVSLVLIQFFKAYSFRSEHRSILDRPFANRWLNLAIVWELCLLAVVVYLPVLHKPFKTFALTPLDWAIVVGTAVSVVPVLEIAKRILRKGLVH